MVKKRVPAFFLVLVLFLLVFSACASSPEKQLVGRWETRIEDEELGSTVLVYHFTSDGEISLEQNDGDTIPFSIPFGTFSVEEEKLTIISDGKTSVFTFSVSEQKLILIQEGETALEFTRI